MKIAKRDHRTIDTGVLIAAVIFASTAAPFMAIAKAPSLAIAFWRNSLAALVLLPLLIKSIPLVKALTRRDQYALVLSGIFLGVHFSCWVPSVKLTSIAAATSLVSTQVIWAAVLERFSGHRAPRMQNIGIAITLAGVLALTGVDFYLKPQTLAGDLLALVGAFAAACYMHIGQDIRPKLPLTTFTSVLYLSAGLTLLLITSIKGITLTGFSAHTWELIVAITIFAQFGGHTLYNKALRSFSPTAVSNAILMQVPLGTTLAWLLMNQKPNLLLIPAALLVATGVVLVIRASKPLDFSYGQD